MTKKKSEKTEKSEKTNAADFKPAAHSDKINLIINIYCYENTYYSFTNNIISIYGRS